VELSDLNQNEQEQHAFFLGLAALLGEGVYNLGELVSRKGNAREQLTN
jgi:26S proteasome regulatory subunit N9